MFYCSHLNPYGMNLNHSSCISRMTEVKDVYFNLKVLMLILVLQTSSFLCASCSYKGYHDYDISQTLTYHWRCINTLDFKEV